MALEQIRVATGGGMAPITSFVEVRPAQAVGTIQRTQLQPTEVIRANVAEEVLLDDIVKNVQAWLEPKRYTRRLPCRSEEQ